MKKSFNSIFLAALTFCALALAMPESSFAAKGAGGSHGSGHDAGADDHHDDHHADGSHSDSHEDGKGKGPKYMGGRNGHSGHSGGGHSVEDDIFHGKHGLRWSDDWPGGSHDEGDDHDHDDEHDH